MLGDMGAEAIAAVLSVCASVRTLDLSWNRIGRKGAQALASSLAAGASSPTAGLRSLCLRGNRIGDIGTMRIADALGSGRCCLTRRTTSSRRTIITHSGRLPVELARVHMHLPCCAAHVFVFVAWIRATLYGDVAVDLWDESISDAGIGSLAASLPQSQLRVLGLWGTPFTDGDPGKLDTVTGRYEDEDSPQAKLSIRTFSHAVRALCHSFGMYVWMQAPVCTIALDCLQSPTPCRFAPISKS